MSDTSLSAPARIAANLRYLALPILLAVGISIPYYLGRVATASDYMGISSADKAFAVILILLSVAGGYLGMLTNNYQDNDGKLGQALRGIMMILMIPAVVTGVLIMIMVLLAVSNGTDASAIVVLACIPIATLPVIISHFDN